MGDSKKVRVYDDRRTLAYDLMTYIAKLAVLSVNSREQFCMALSGGSLTETLAMALDQDLPDAGDAWSGWQVFWADERWVPPSSPDSNYGEAMKRFLSRVPISTRQIHAMDTSQPLDKTARNYGTTLESVLNPGHNQYPRFDLILLGIGPDGHTASLFPDHPVLNETKAWVSPVTDAPKPPPNRITLTLPVINHARNIAWVATGVGKADIVAKILHPSPGSKALPAGRVKPADGDMRWFIDRSAAAAVRPDEKPIEFQP